MTSWKLHRMVFLFTFWTKVHLVGPLFFGTLGGTIFKAGVDLSLAHFLKKKNFVVTSHHFVEPLVLSVWSFVLYERPILGGHLKAHSEKHCGFHENWCFSWKPLWFLWNWQCLWKLMLFMKSIAVSMKSTWKTADWTQICLFNLVFHRGQRWGQQGLSYIPIFGTPYVWWCMWCMCGTCVCI